MSLDYEAMARDLMRALRGTRSQVAFARRLGYRSNAVYTWESGRRWPPASVFLGAAHRAGVDVAPALRGFLRTEPAWLAEDPAPSPAWVGRLLTELRGATPIGQLAQRAGRSRFAVSRWLQGQSEPRLPDLLRVIEASSLRVLEFVSLFADPASMGSTRAAWERLGAARTLAWSSPWAQAVLLALELVPYRALPRHDDAWLADRLGIDVARVQQAVSLLLEAGQVVPDGAHYAPVEVPTLDVRSPAIGRDLKRFWADVARERLASGAPGTFSYNLVAVSEADLVALDEMLRAQYRAIRARVADSAPAERLALVQLQLVPLG
jgi:transcriptional regulator with XRE-family HTH domain